MECTVIIPTIKINDLVLKIVKRTLSSDKKLSIIIVYNDYSKKIANSKRVKLIKTKKKNISTKRNIGVHKSKTKYIALLDSDAYPDENWFQNAKSILKRNKKIGIVTGPEQSFPDQTFLENTVGLCNKSFLITGTHNFRKSVSESRFYSEASSCNIIMRRQDYLNINGMNENIYVGEDEEFSLRITGVLKKKIYFSNNVKIFHQDRNLKGFIIQRYSRGFTTVNFFSRLKNFLKKISIKNFLNQRFELFVPFFFILFLLLGPFFYLNEILKISYFSVILLYFFVILAETIKLTYNKIIFFIPVLFSLVIGSIIPGIAQLFEMFNFKIRIFKYYRNKNDI